MRRSLMVVLSLPALLMPQPASASPSSTLATTATAAVRPQGEGFLVVASCEGLVTPGPEVEAGVMTEVTCYVNDASVTTTLPGPHSRSTIATVAFLPIELCVRAKASVLDAGNGSISTLVNKKRCEPIGPEA